MALDHGELPHYYSPVELSSCMAYNEIKLEASKYYSWAVSPLMRCPPEIQSEICNTLTAPSDLSKLSKTCKVLWTITRPKLFSHIDLALPREFECLTPMETLLSLSSEVFQWTTKLSVSIRFDLSEQENDKDLQHPKRLNENNLDHALFSGQSQLLDTLVRMLINKIPKNRLASFRWDHCTLMTEKTLVTLQQRHGNVLKDLWLRDSCFNWNQLGPLKSLSSFGVDHFCEIQSDDRNDYTDDKLDLSTFSLSDCKSLNHLHLGIKKELLNRRSVPDMTNKALKTFFKVNKRKSSNETCPFFNLESAYLIGLPLWVLEYPICDVSQLRSLRLESSHGVAESLSSLVLSCWTSRLKSFSIRHERSSAKFQKTLTTFLHSFAGLENLAILLEGPRGKLSLSQIIGAHGQTLQTLVFEERDASPCIQSDRKGNHILDTSHRSDLDLHELSETCPNLMELGLALPWEAFYDEPNCELSLESISLFSQLKTMNIRNLPHYTWKATPSPPGGYETSFRRRQEDLLRLSIRSYINSRMSPSELPLNIIALGAVTDDCGYVNRTSSLFPDLGQYANEYLCPRFYHISYHRDIRGKVVPILTLVAKENPMEVEEVSDHLKIFEPSWLN